MNPKVVNMDKADLQNALDALGKKDRDKIQALVLELDRGVKGLRGRKSNFGYWSALELLAKLGIFMNSRD
jgi:hypothetical protein